MTSNMTLCMDSSFHSINPVQCSASRILGSTLVSVAMLSTAFNLRFLFWSLNHGRNRSRQNLFIFSMIFSSMLVIGVMIPSVILQSFTCQRLCSPFYCQLEGFISYLNGCVHIFMLMMISIIRYVTVLHGSVAKRRFRRNSNLAVVISWLLGLVFAVPPLFKWNRFIPEGLGFHCGLNWSDRSTSSHIYLFSTMLFVYFIPLVVLSIVNTYVYCAIRRLIGRATTNNVQSMFPAALIDLSVNKNTSPAYVSLSSTTTQSFRLKSKHTPKSPTRNPRYNEHRTIDTSQIRQMMRMNRLKADRRFALATIFLVAEYLLSWTPYACMALSHLFHITSIIEQPLLITVCAFIAKVSMIINPFIYILAIKTKQLKVICLLKRCNCLRCRVRWTDCFVNEDRCDSCLAQRLIRNERFFYLTECEYVYRCSRETERRDRQLHDKLEECLTDLMLNQRSIRLMWWSDSCVHITEILIPVVICALVLLQSWAPCSCETCKNQESFLRRESTDSMSNEQSLGMISSCESKLFRHR